MDQPDLLHYVWSTADPRKQRYDAALPVDGSISKREILFISLLESRISCRLYRAYCICDLRRDRSAPPVHGGTMAAA